MISQFGEDEFCGEPIATSLKMWKKINSFIIIKVLSRHKHASPNIVHASFFSPHPPPPFKNLLHGP